MNTVASNRVRNRVVLPTCLVVLNVEGCSFDDELSRSAFQMILAAHDSATNIRCLSVLDLV